MLNDIMALLFPDIRKCIMCSQKINTPLPVCEECEKEITYYRGEGTCDNCGRFYHGPTCKGIKLKKVLAVARYTGPWKELIHKFKFNNQKYLAKGLAEKMAERLENENIQIDIITYIPATSKTRSQRGYDQSELLAQELAAILEKPMVCTLNKKGNRPRQHTLPLNQRKNHWEEEFTLIKGTNLKGKRILLIDDIYTTGNTLYHAVRALKTEKTKSIASMVLAN